MRFFRPRADNGSFPHQQAAYSGIRKVNKETKQQGQPLTPFVLYSFRHTFLANLGENGCDVWTLAPYWGSHLYFYALISTLRANSARRCFTDSRSKCKFRKF